MLCNTLWISCGKVTKSAKKEDRKPAGLDEIEMKPAEKPVSLRPLKFEDAVRGLAASGPPSPSADSKQRKKNG